MTISKIQLAKPQRRLDCLLPHPLDTICHVVSRRRIKGLNVMLVSVLSSNFRHHLNRRL